jgi:hypothetical protein
MKLAHLNATEGGMIEERHISNYVGETVVVELRSCSGCFLEGLRKTMKISVCLSGYLISILNII